MLKTQKTMPSTNDLERAERIREVLEALNEINKRFPIIVEGKKDVTALRQLGLGGEIIYVHRGMTVYDFCEDIAERFNKVVILMDWDMRGNRLFDDISGNLRGHWEEFSAFREILRMLCQKDLKDIEGIPKLLLRLEGLRPLDPRFDE